MAGTQEVYSVLNIKNNELKNVKIEQVSALPDVISEQKGRVVVYKGIIHINNGTKWVGMADAEAFDLAKAKLDTIEEGAQVNKLEKILFQGSGESSASALPVSGKGVTLDLSGYALKTDVASVYKVKGSVATVGDLPTENLTVGDVYNVQTGFTDNKKKYPAGTNVVYVETEGDQGSGKWDALGGVTDLSEYYKKNEVDEELKKKQDKLTTGQMNAVNSGITEEKVKKYDDFIANLPIMTLRKTTDLTTADAGTTIASGMGQVLIAQVTDSTGKVLLCETTISGASVNIKVSDKITGAIVTIIGTRSETTSA